jgi:hypothetical protein
MESRARLPTGAENVKAVYRNGIGKVGNVKERQISCYRANHRCKEVINRCATGGADKNRDQARARIPPALKALTGWSPQDYTDFALFAGIGKASLRISWMGGGGSFFDHRRADDIPMTRIPTCKNLLGAVRYGDLRQLSWYVT